ncbi:MAG: hypothetical protein ACTSRI_00660, partial [Promethearchaeota archaeon]
FFIASLIGKRDYKVSPQRPLNIRFYITRKENFPSLAFAFIWGFFFINTYYSSILILESAQLLGSLNIFAISLFLSILIFVFPSGIIADTLGRRFTILLGIAIQAFAFMLLSFTAQDAFVLLYVFPIFLGIGFSMALVYGQMVFIELSENVNVRDNTTLLVSFAVPGMVLGILLTELVKPYILNEPAILTVILLFICVAATIIIFQLKETLPSKSEIFIKPESINEEDLTLYKERKICLVCKGKASGFNVFVCPECGVLYCLKCAKALSDLENMCWVCNGSLDDTKPMKPIEDEEKEGKEDKGKMQIKPKKIES